MHCKACDSMLEGNFVDDELCGECLDVVRKMLAGPRDEEELAAMLSADNKEMLAK